MSTIQVYKKLESKPTTLVQELPIKQDANIGPQQNSSYCAADLMGLTWVLEDESY